MIASCLHLILPCSQQLFQLHTMLFCVSLSSQRDTKLITPSVGKILKFAKNQYWFHLAIYKHKKNDYSSKLHITKSKNKTICPVVTMHNYLCKHKSTKLKHVKPQNFIFMHEDGTALSKTKFCKVLNSAIKTIGLDPRRYKSHSFRIGRTTDLIMKNKYSENQVAKMGRCTV